MGYRINYSKVISQANSISDDADRLSAQISQLSSMEQEFHSVWKGQAADAFLARLSTMRSDMSRTKSQISNLASNIRYCAERIQREDEAEERRAAALKAGS